ncbi:MAG TPA: hypothetical protein VKD72_09615, partial [Gemmataceae bacterium]|nr:hypothetical protein [Gemmataceae bacterium]
MPHFLRPFVLLLALLLVALSGSMPAQPPRLPRPPQPAQSEVDSTDLGGITLVPQKSPFVSHIDAARRAILDEDWAVATTLLQKVLDLPEDALVQLTRKGPDGKETKVLVSLRAAADRLLGEFPVAGRAFYQREYGPKAAELLRQARLFGEPTILAEVMRRYLHTEAGAEAAERLATHHLDRGHSVLAALCFEKLIQRSGPSDLSGLALFKAILAFRRVGDREQVDRLWKALESKVGKDGLELRNRRFKLDELRKELDRLGKPSSPGIRSDWPMFRGDAARSARAAGSNPFPKPVWSGQTAREKVTRAYLERASEALRSQKRPVLVPFHPIAVALRTDTGELPLVIYRTYWGIHARVVRKTHLNKDEKYEAAEMYWEVPSTWSIDKMVRNNQHIGPVTEWLKEYVENGVWSSVLFENTTVGTLTTDHVRVYAVEDFTVPPPTPLGGRKVDSVEQKLKDAADHNRLQAYELESGKLLWEIGSKAEDKEPKGLEDIFFLGPPLPLERKLYVLAEKKEGLCLLTLAPATGKILTSRLLGKVHDRIPENPRRRINAAPLAHAEGILVCPTNAGAVLGFDLASNRLLWAHAYRDKGDSYAALSDPRFGPPPPGK